VTVAPTLAVWLTGCVVIAAVTVATLTVSVAALLGIEPAEFVTRTEYAPASAGWTFVRLSVALAAPRMAAPSLRH
jgi:hypothetical protein